MENNCEKHLGICKAECCRTFSLNIDIKTKYKKGDKIILKKSCTKDLELYYKLHGVKYNKGFISFTLDNFIQEDYKLTIFYRCHGLTNELKCKYHGTKIQPSICQYPNINHHKDLTNVEVTENCIYYGKK